MPTHNNHNAVASDTGSSTDDGVSQETTHRARSKPTRRSRPPFSGFWQVLCVLLVICAVSGGFLIQFFVDQLVEHRHIKAQRALLKVGNQAGQVKQPAHTSGVAAGDVGFLAQHRYDDVPGDNTNYNC